MGLGLGEALLELVDATGGIDEFLHAGKERVADVADADDNAGFGGTGFDDVSAGTADLGILVFRMYIGSHKKGRKLTSERPVDKREFLPAPGRRGAKETAVPADN